MSRFLVLKNGKNIDGTVNYGVGGRRGVFARGFIVSLATPMV
jgi:hypothetical protein